MFSPPVFATVAEEFDHVGQEESPDFHQLSTGGGVLEERGNYF